METIVESRQLAITEDSSDRSESSNISQEYQSRDFEDYDFVKRLKRSVDESGIVKNDENTKKLNGNKYLSGNIKYDDVSLSIGKSKDYGFIANERIGDGLNYQIEKSRENDDTTMECRMKETTVKEAFLNFSKDSRYKYINGNYERSPKELNYLVEREIKEYSLGKCYNLPLERMKEFNLPLERMRDNQTMILQRERLNNVEIIENSRIIDNTNNHRNFHLQSRNSKNFDTIDYERMRRHNMINRMDFTAQNLVGNNSQNHRQTGVTQIQEQQQQQIKSFTIDAILAHKNNQRERHQRNQQQQQLRKAARQECQEVTTKSASCTGNTGSGSGSNGSVSGNSAGGKAKRVRTIFTAEQLERLEGEFARQQYMVGPERLYLAHALRLTEAQVKVWFQNRRIKWRKVNHEQHFQAVTEHRQRCSLPSLDINEDDSNETNKKWCNSAIASTISHSDDSRELREIHPSSVVKP